MIAHLDGHFHFLAVHDTAGANGQDFCYIGLFLGAAGEDDATLGGFFCFYHLNDHAISQRFQFHSGLPPYSKSFYYKQFE